MADPGSGTGAANDANVATVSGGSLVSIPTQTDKEVKAQLEANLKNAKAKVALMQSRVKAAEQAVATAQAELDAHG